MVRLSVVFAEERFCGKNCLRKTMPATTLQRVPGGNGWEPAESLKVGSGEIEARKRAGFASAQVIILLLEIGITGWLIRCPSGMRLGLLRCGKDIFCLLASNRPPKHFVQMQVNLFVFPALQVELPCQGGEFQILRNEARHSFNDGCWQVVTSCDLGGWWHFSKFTQIYHSWDLAGTTASQNFITICHISL